MLTLAEVKRLPERALGLVEAIRFGARRAVQGPQARVGLLQVSGFPKCYQGLTPLTALLGAPCPTEQKLGA